MSGIYNRGARNVLTDNNWGQLDFGLARMRFAPPVSERATEGMWLTEPSFARSLPGKSPVGGAITDNDIIGSIDTIGDSGLPHNYQPVESAWYIPGPNALVDVYSPNPSNTGTLVVDGAHIIAACDIPGDNDWFAVTLTAGQIYQFGQYAYAGHAAGVEGAGFPLADAYLEVYDSAGNLLAIADGGGPNTPSGLDALMTFEAPSSGTFYVNATSYDNDGDGIGDFAGDYELFAITATGGYTTHYDISSPLHSIDWGGVLVNREHVSVRNPDGDEGTRETGEPAAEPATVEGNALGYPGKNVIYLYFAGEGDTYANADSTIPAQVTAQNPYQYEIQAMLTAAGEFSEVADVVFVSNYTFNAATGLYERNENIEYKPGPTGAEEGVQYATGVDSDGFDADFFYWSYPGTPGPGISLLGSMNPPDYGDEGVAQFNSADERWNAQMLQPGGFSFVTLIHEFGHGMGLAHPHDTGGGSSVMQGVQTNGVPGDDGGAGAYDLNQGVNTMMSYNDGWEMSPYGRAQTNNEGYGWLGSLMALDIAVIQDKYGVNEDWATGNDTYVLKDVNEWGVYIDSATGQPAEHNASNQATARDGYYVGQSTYYSSIWDGGGVDQITYNGARNTNIDLRAATLQYEYGGAGWMSYAYGIHGGFTVANGVTIENATTGSGNDTLIGNAVANSLYAGAGDDIVLAGAGNDYVDGGDGADQLSGEGGNDAIAGGAGLDRIVGGDGDDYVAAGIGADVVYGDAGADTLNGDDGDDYLSGGADNDSLFGGYGADALDGGAGADFIDGGADNDIIAGRDGDDRAYGIDGDDTIEGAAGNDILYGHAGLDALHGQDGNDFLDGDLGNDLLTGGNGLDVIVGGAGDDHVFAGADADIVAGSAGNDVAYGEGGDDDLRGEDGNDYLDGGDGNDFLTGANGADQMVGGAGDDRAYGGADNDIIVGGLGADILYGEAGNDQLRGGGNADYMEGGGGADAFVFDTALGGGNIDNIGDFAAGVDEIVLDDAVFAGLALGELSASAFVVGSAAQDADDRIIYDSTTGALFYDSDGTGGAAAVQFATLSTSLNLTAYDFMVV